MGYSATSASSRFRPQWATFIIAILILTLGVVFTQQALAVQPRVEAAADNHPITLPSLKLYSQAPNLDAVDCNAVPCVALTFDDGPDPMQTPAVLDVLEREHVRATFFMIGYRVVAYSSIVRRAFMDGHSVENHSWNHQDFTKLQPAQIAEQVKLTQDAIQAAGLPAPTLLRPPFGTQNPAIVQQVGMPIILWNVDPKDWKETDPARVAAASADPATPGSIILLHSVHPVDAPALSDVITRFRAKGYQFVTVPELLHLPSGATGVYYHR